MDWGGLSKVFVISKFSTRSCNFWSSNLSGIQSRPQPGTGVCMGEILFIIIAQSPAATQHFLHKVHINS